MHLVCALTISTLFIIYILVYSQPIYQEGFYGNFPGPKYCGDCNQIWDVNKCMSCNNCGWCVDPNGRGTCVLGDQNGPFFADCVKYMYNGGRLAAPPPMVAPYGPPIIPWYQRIVPWFGGYSMQSW